MPVWQRPSCSSSPPCLATSREGAADIEKRIISPLFYIEKHNFPQEFAYILGKFLRFAYILGRFYLYFAYVLGIFPYKLPMF